MKHNKTMFLMWTDITITIFWDNNPIKDINTAFSIFHSLELEFSRFLPDSSLNILNKNRTREVSDRFIDVLKKCKKIYIDTGFYFNPLISLKQIWYGKSFDLNEFKKEIVNVNLDFDKVKINWNQISLQKDQVLDLWGIVKWFGVDMARQYLDKKWYKDYIIDAWGDIYTAWSNEFWKKILVWIDNPFTKGEIFATLELENKAIATSGTYKRKRIIKGQEYNHIINPITWTNNNEIISITLVANDCYIVDAYATSCIAMWIEKSLFFLKRNNIEWIIFWTDKKIYTTDWIEKYNIKFI